MQIDVAEFWKLQHPGRDDAAITDNDNGIGIDFCELRFQLFVGLDFFRLVNRQAQLQGALLDWRGNQLQPAASRAIRLGHDQSYVERLDQLLQCGNRKLRSATENNRVLG